MADQRKSFRPRRLAFGGRFLPRAMMFGAALAICAGAHAESDGLKNGAASLAAGKYDAAVRQLSATINADGVSPGEAARALYLRGLAYRKMGESARAAADLGAAIWLGLPEADRVKALVNRGLAYQAAGLSQEGEAQLAAARKLGGSSAVETLVAEGGGIPAGTAGIAAFSTEIRPEESSIAGARRAEPVQQAEPPTRTAAASPGGWGASVADEAQPSSSSSGGNRLTRWFGSLTDSSDDAPSTPQAAPAAAPTPAPAPAPAETTQVRRPAPAAAPASGWSATTETEVASAAPSEGGSRWTRLFNRSSEATPQAQPAAAPAAPGGNYRLQLATSRSEAEAKALWKQVSQAQNLPGIQPAIERVEIGDFGTFYALRIGPFPDKAESLRVCNALKRSGIDCSPAEQ